MHRLKLPGLQDERLINLLISEYETDVESALTEIWFENVEALRSEPDGAVYNEIVRWLIERTGGCRVAYRFEQRCLKWLPPPVQQAICETPQAAALATRARREFPLFTVALNRFERTRPPK